MDFDMDYEVNNVTDVDHEVNNAMSPCLVLAGSNCLLDSGSTHTILTDRNCFETYTEREVTLQTVAYSFTAKGFGRAVLKLGGTRIIVIEHAIHQPTATRNLLSLKDLLANDLHFATSTEDYFHILEKPMDLSTTIIRYRGIGNELYPVDIEPFSRLEINTTELTCEDKLSVWHNRLGHPGLTLMRSMMLISLVRL
jgi:hypothetical protein